jgi:hypothetical protein
MSTSAEDYLKFMFNNADMVKHIIEYLKSDKKEHLRLFIICTINPSWHSQIINFVMENMSFSKLLPIVSIDEYPAGFNKNPYENTAHAPVNIFETILNGLAYAGSDIEYGNEQNLLMLEYFRQYEELSENMELPEQTQPEKVPIYKALIKMMIDNGICMNDLLYSPEHMDLIENVEGMTESTITLLHLLYGEISSDKCIPYGHSQFKRGMAMFYGLDNPSKEELKQIVDGWSNKKVGFMFIIQYAHYSEYIDSTSA